MALECMLNRRNMICFYLGEDLLVQLEPSGKALRIRVLQAEVPDLAKTHCLHHLQRSYCCCCYYYFETNNGPQSDVLPVLRMYKVSAAQKLLAKKISFGQGNHGRISNEIQISPHTHQFILPYRQFTSIRLDV